MPLSFVRPKKKNQKCGFKYGLALIMWLIVGEYHNIYSVASYLITLFNQQSTWNFHHQCATLSSPDVSEYVGLSWTRTSFRMINRYLVIPTFFILRWFFIFVTFFHHSTLCIVLTQVGTSERERTNLPCPARCRQCSNLSFFFLFFFFFFWKERRDE